MFHPFTNQELAGISIPQEFNDPFNYQPCPISLLAVNDLMTYIESTPSLKQELSEGKMLGVLVVRRDETIGYLAAFSGQIGGSNLHPFFVTPIYDLLEANGFFKQGEAIISNINHRIADIQQSQDYLGIKQKMQDLQTQSLEEITAYKDVMQQAKQKRDAIRLENNESNNNNNILPELIKESQFQKAELKRIKNKWEATLADNKHELDQYENEIKGLQQERKRLSYELQLKIFEHFVLVNAKGETQDINTLFQSACGTIPPAGTGECAGPRLLQYAYKHRLQPICMAEFWYGASPKQEVRHHGQFYPACQHKCAPILPFMLEGLTIHGKTNRGSDGNDYRICDGISYINSDRTCDKYSDKDNDRNTGKDTDKKANTNKNTSINTVQNSCTEDNIDNYKTDIPQPLHTTSLDIIYEDADLLVVNKPAGLLSTPGKIEAISLYDLVKAKYPEATGPLLVHRLDMSTSGLVIIAKNKWTHYHLQKQFLTREIEKRYAAWLDGNLLADEGTITLPLCPDPNDRPRQMVHETFGKPATTYYKVVKRHKNKTLVFLYPHTGRTHQLRVHASHVLGLNCPIVGDALYGRRLQNENIPPRLMLHAEYVEFTHPATGERIKVECPAEFRNLEF